MLDLESNNLPEIPDKLFFTISEVSKLCGVRAHVLRYWEQEFVQLQNLRRRSNRRVYERKDVLFIRELRSLLHEKGYTINGARQFLKEKNNETEESSQVGEISIEAVINELEEIKKILQEG